MNIIKFLGTLVLTVSLFACSQEDNSSDLLTATNFETNYPNNNEIVPVYTPELTEIDNTPQVIVHPVEPIVISYEDPLLNETTVHFAYDSSGLTQETKEILDAHSKYLIESGEKISLEGHTDERGTREYNMALGERRAKSVKSYLTSKGVNSKQLEVISYGSEKPLIKSSNTKAWAKNRRVELHK